MTYEFEQTEEEYMEIEAPECFSYMDKDDMNCRRCQIKDYCGAEQEETRAPCFGLVHNEDNVECSRCLDESQCVEQLEKLLQGDDQVTKGRKVRVRRPRKAAPKKVEEPVVEEELVEEEEQEPTPAPKKKPVRRRKTAAKKPQPEPEPEEEEEEELDEDDGEDYDSWGLRDLRAELKDRGLDSTGRKAVLVDRLMADDAGELEEEEDEEEEPAPKPTRRKTVKKAAPKSKRVVRKKKVEEPEPEEEEEEQEQDEIMAQGTFDDFFSALPQGAVFSLIRLDEDTIKVTFGGEVGAVAVAPKGRRAGGLGGKAFEKEAWTEEFYNYLYVQAPDSDKAWRDMTVEERYAYADNLGVEWDEHDNEKTDQMRMAQAVREELGIAKWKPQYDSRAARKELRGYA